MQQKDLKDTPDFFGLQDIEPQEELHKATAAKEEAFSISESELEAEEGIQIPLAQHVVSTKIPRKHSASTETKAIGPPLPVDIDRHQMIAKDALPSGSAPKAQPKDSSHKMDSKVLVQTQPGCLRSQQLRHRAFRHPTENILQNRNQNILQH
ncbi:hypothetical protein NDU88_002576 [Pleurodeles waltl]|uniref:Uncharacterized protein n=1 Tax=Pleurodeles waltl TaxID=8319 RepID=A0AAV7UYW1_PLEWA|nr:hypothetical protein NDU88_002576 [Pleurodeles waltl]